MGCLLLRICALPGFPTRFSASRWRAGRDFMPQGMVLKSEPFASNLWDPARRFTYEKFLAERGIAYRRVNDPIPVERFVEYGHWFRRHAVGEVRRVKVRRVARADGAFSLELDDGTVAKARRVVLATGHMGFRHVPDELKGLPDGMCLHSTALHDLRQFAGRDVTVIGAGASALESLALLHEAGATTRLVARRQQIQWNPLTPDPNLIERLRTPLGGIGPGWRSWAVSELPFLYRRMFKPAKRHRIFPHHLGPRGSVVVARSGRRQARCPLGASDRFGTGRGWPSAAWPDRPRRCDGDSHRSRGGCHRIRRGARPDRLP